MVQVVIRHTAEGLGNKEIAGRLGLSVKTIETDRGRAMDKLGTRGRAEPVRYAKLRGGLTAVSRRAGPRHGSHAPDRVFAGPDVRAPPGRA